MTSIDFYCCYCGFILLGVSHLISMTSSYAAIDDVTSAIDNVTDDVITTPATVVQYVNPRPVDLAVECRELRSVRYLSDGFCTSRRPVTDVVCTGSCLPIRQLPWYAEFIKVWSRTKIRQYRCVDDVVRYRQVPFICDNGDVRTHRIRVVRSCTCKRYTATHNRSTQSRDRRSRDRHRKRKRKLRLAARRRRRQQRMLGNVTPAEHLS